MDNLRLRSGRDHDHRATGSVMRTVPLLATLLVAGCPRTPGDHEVDSRLAVIEGLSEGYPKIALSGEFVFRSVGEDVDTFQVGDPASLQFVGSAPVQLDCFFFDRHVCQGLVAQGEFVYLHFLGSVARTRPPSGGEEWLFTSAFAVDSSIKALPGGLIVPAAVIPKEPEPVLHFFSTSSSGDPVLTASLPIAATSLHVQDQEVAVITTGEEIVWLDGMDLANPIELSRSPIDFGSLEPPPSVRHLVVAGDRAVGIVRRDTHCFLITFSIQGGNLTAIDESKAKRPECESLAFSYPHVFTATWGESRASLEIFELGTDGGFVSHSFVNVKHTVTDIAVDESRGLVFLGTYAGIEIHDLEKLRD